MYNDPVYVHLVKVMGNGQNKLFFLIFVTDILSQFQFHQLIDQPTHIHGHILDVVCARKSFSTGICPLVADGLSDHFLITFSVNFPVRPSCPFRLVKIRKISKIKTSEFRSDLVKSDLIKYPHQTASLLSHQYFHTLKDLLDKHAPEKRQKIPKHPDSGFINSEIISAKRQKRKLERVWRHDGSSLNRSRYRAAVNKYNRLLELSKTRYYTNIVTENQGNPKALWNSFKKILHKTATVILPDSTTHSDLSNIFGNYFSDKITKLRSSLSSSSTVSPQPNPIQQTLSSFHIMSEEEILKIIKSHQTNLVTLILSQQHWLRSL